MRCGSAQGWARHLPQPHRPDPACMFAAGALLAAARAFPMDEGWLGGQGVYVARHKACAEPRAAARFTQAALLPRAAGVSPPPTLVE